jgi:hypothetical protein
MTADCRSQQPATSIRREKNVPLCPMRHTGRSTPMNSGQRYEGDNSYDDIRGQHLDRTHYFTL